MNISKQLCRICLNNPGAISIYDKDANITVIDAILSVTSVQILCNENYPNSICTSCFDRINSALKLRQDVEHSEEKLKQIQIDCNKQTINSEIKIKIEENLNDNVDLKDTLVDQNSSESEEEYTPEETEYARKCQVCGKEFTIHTMFIEHLKVHNDAKSYKCGICSRNFSNSSNLLVHKRCHTKEMPYTCKVCNKKFRHSSGLKRHMLVHTNEKSFICVVCNKPLKYSISLKQHMLTHESTHTLPHFKCDQCFKDFRSKTLLQLHMVFHSDVKKHICGTCGKAFHRADSMNRHIRTVHFKEKKYKCPECGKAFCDSSNLNVHFRIHTGEKSFKCKYCHTKFNRSSSLHRHIIHKHQHTMTQNDDKPIVGTDSE